MCGRCVSGRLRRSSSLQVVDRGDRLHVTQQRRPEQPAGDDPLVGEDVVPRRDGRAVVPARRGTQAEAVDPAIRRDRHPDGSVHDSAALGGCAQQTGEEVPRHPGGAVEGGDPRDEAVRLEHRDLDRLGRLGARREILREVEGLSPGGVGPDEVEGLVPCEGQPQQCAAGPRVVVQLPLERQGPLVVLERLDVGIHAPRGVPCLDQVARRTCGVPGLRPVVTEQAEVVVAVADEWFEQLGGPSVKSAALVLEQTGVGHLLHEPMPEPVLGGGAAAGLGDEVSSLQLGQRSGEGGATQQVLEEGTRELATDHGGGGDHSPGVGGEPVEPGLDRLLDRPRDGGAVERPDQAVAVPVPVQPASLDQVVERLLEEERVPAGPPGQQVVDGCGDRRAGERRGERSGICRPEPAQLDLEVSVRHPLAGLLAQPPGRVVAIAAIAEHQPEALLVGHREQLRHELEGGLVGPVEVVEDDDERPPARLLRDQGAQRVDRALTHAVARQLAQPRRRDRLQRDAGHRCQERVEVGAGLPQDAVEPRTKLEPDLRLGCVGGQVQPVAEEAADRPVREALGIGDPLPLEHPHPPAELVQRLVDQAGLADPDLTGDDDNSAAAFGHALEGLDDSGAFGGPAHERCGRDRGLLTLPQDPERLHEAFPTLDLQGADRLAVEPSPDLVGGHRTDHEAAGQGIGLQSRGDVHRVAQGVVEDVRGLLAREDGHGPGVDRGTRRQQDAVRRRDLLRQRPQRVVDAERRPDCPLGIVAVRERGAEHGQDAVTRVLCHRAAVQQDLLAGHPGHLVEQQLRPLCPELFGDGRGVDDVGDEHRDDPPFALGLHAHDSAAPGCPGDGSSIMGRP